MLIAVTVVVAIASCGVGVVAGLAIRPARGTGASAAGTQSPSLSPTSTAGDVAPGDGAALLAKVLPMPTGATALDVDGSTGGVMDLNQFIQREFEGDPTELARVKARGFNVAVERDWVGTDGVEVHLQLIAFGLATGAESYVLGQISAFNKDDKVTGSFTVPVTLGTGYEKSALDKAGFRRMVVMAEDGPVDIFIYLYTPAALDRAGATDLMQRQWAALAHS